MLSSCNLKSFVHKLSFKDAVNLCANMASLMSELYLRWFPFYFEKIVIYIINVAGSLILFCLHKIYLFFTLNIGSLFRREIKPRHRQSVDSLREQFCLELIGSRKRFEITPKNLPRQPNLLICIE